MPKIEALNFFYLAMPEILDVGDGSQDALLVRVSAGGYTGWGECEASPLTTIASLVCPMSHSACKPVAVSVLGETLDSSADIARIHRKVRQNSLDLLQADHALSGIDVALWDLLGKLRQEPVYKLLGFKRAYPKRPYFSLLFGATPADTYQKARQAARQGFSAVKFGWGTFGCLDLKHDEDQVAAARAGLEDEAKKEAILCIDAGTVWGEDVAVASQRLDILRKCAVTWLEEPFHTYAHRAYCQLGRASGSVKLAGGEGAHNEYMAQQMIDYAGLGYIQVDCGRVGGITSARRVFEHAQAKGVQYVNHTFTSHLALSASLQVFAGAPEHALCEYPGQLTPLADQLTADHLEVDANGAVHLPERPGLGLEPDLTAIKKYVMDVEMIVNKRMLYRTPAL